MVNPAPPPGPGSTFGPYRIDAVLSTGRSGVVYRATDQRLGRSVALKVVVGPLASSAEYVERFQREAATVARLESPHVVQIFDHGVQDGVPFVASQYAAGGDLGALLGRLGPMPPLLAAQTCSQVAEALRDAHGAGVVHRNLKPGNVLLRDDRLDRVHVLVSDFGVDATGDGGVTEPASAPGAWSYLAPERLRGEPGSEASDVYAVGCLLHEAVTGRPPYAGTDVEVATAHMQAPVPQLPGADESTARLNQVLARALAKDPAQRYPSAAALRDELRAIAGILSPPPPVPPVAPPSQQPTMAPGPGFLPPPAGAPASAPGGPPPAYQSMSVPQGPPYVGPGGPGGKSGQGNKKVLLVAGAAALALVLVMGVVIAVVVGDDDSEPTADPTISSPTDDPSTDPTEPTDPASTDPSEPTESTTEDGPVTPDLAGARTGDLDGDGKGDLALLTSDGLRLMASDGTGFRDPIVRRNRAGLVGLSGDLDDDGRVDLVRVLGDPPRMTAATSVTGAPTSTLQTPDSSQITSALDVPMALGDVDGDGNLDLVALTRLSPTKIQVDVAPGGGDGSFAPTKTWFSGQIGEAEGGIYVADVDGDGNDDVVHVSTGRETDYEPQATLLASDGSALTVTGDLTTVDAGGFAVGTVLTGDLDGDDVEEIISTTADGLKVNVWSWNGTTFDQDPWYDDTDNFETDEVTASDFVISDVDGDGFDDVVVIGNTRDYEGYVDSVFLSDGSALTFDKTWRRSLKLGDVVAYSPVGRQINQI